MFPSVPSILLDGNSAVFVDGILAICSTMYFVRAHTKQPGTAVWSVLKVGVLGDMSLNSFYGLRLVRTRIRFKLCVQIQNI